MSKQIMSNRLEKSMEVDLKQHMQQIEVAPQFQNSIKIEGTKDGPRVTIHTYGDDEVETKLRAIRLYKETLQQVESLT